MSCMFDRYQISGEELLVNNNFNKSLEGWQKIGAGITVLGDSQPIVRIISERGHEIVAIRQILKNIKKGQPVRFSGAIKTQGVGRGDKAWEAARMIFVAMDDDGRSVYNMPHVLVTRNGTVDWERFSRVFLASSNAVSYYVEIQLVNVKGIVWAKDLSLQPVKETLAFSLFWSVGVLLWAVVSLWILAPHLRNIFSSKWNILVLVLMMVALSGTLAPIDSKNRVIETLRLFISLANGEAWLFRVGHFSVYFLLSVVVFWKAHPGRPEVSRFGLLVLFAMATEIMQFMVDGRTPRVSDILADVSGIALGLFISRIFSRFKTQQ